MSRYEVDSRDGGQEGVRGEINLTPGGRRIRIKGRNKERKKRKFEQREVFNTRFWHFPFL